MIPLGILVREYCTLQEFEGKLIRMEGMTYLTHTTMLKSFVELGTVHKLNTSTQGALSTRALGSPSTAKAP